uniref:Peptidase S1 domain-containing protein n=1 Tax=Megaselia scalaris TaxID=36166 RepID=T1H1M8_MEGSC
MVRGHLFFLVFLKDLSEKCVGGRFFGNKTPFIGSYTYDCDIRKLVNPTLQICAGGNGSDTCQGDSGGPLMFLDRTSFVKPYNILIGITSFGSICGGPVSGVYTK